jgi:E3 ubiquitin-protein ligase MARCH1/8
METPPKCVITMSRISTDHDFSEKKTFLNKKPPDKVVLDIVDNTEVSLLQDPLSRRVSSESIFKSMCRICHGEEVNLKNFITPCNCSGTLRYVHHSCLNKWLKTNGKQYFIRQFLQSSFGLIFYLGSKKCELCNEQFITKSKLNSWHDFKMCELTPQEKKVLLLTNLLYVIGILCNVWTLLNFINLLSSLMQVNDVGWKFYTILFLCLITNMCIVSLCILIFQVWFRFVQKMIRQNQTTVIISK